jgi:perosamine synthetase
MNVSNGWRHVLPDTPHAPLTGPSPRARLSSVPTDTATPQDTDRAALAGKNRLGAPARTVAAEPPAVPFARPLICDEARAAAADVLASGWVTTGVETYEFEREFAAYAGAQHAVAVSSCSVALELSVRALRLPPGAHVLLPAITFCGAAHAILNAGLRPVLVDVDPDTALATEAAVRAAARDCAPAAFVNLHLGGYPVDPEPLAAAAGLPARLVIDDAAHAVGTWVGDRPVGALCHATCFSFYATKNLPIGEGGMITTDDAALAKWLRRARLHGMSADAWRRYLPGGGWRYSVDDVGLKANMTDLQAAIGRAQLRQLPAWQSQRTQIAHRYAERLSRLPGLRLPSEPPAGQHAWHLYVVHVLESFGRSRDDLLERLAKRGIGTSVHFIPLHHMPYFRRKALMPVGGLPGADAVFPRLLSLPLYPQLSDSAVDHVSGVIAELARFPRPPRASTRERGRRR